MQAHIHFADEGERLLQGFWQVFGEHPMSFEEVDGGTHVMLAPEGKFNLVAAPPLKARIDDLVAAGKSRLVVDLHAVDFIDSSGLGALIGGLAGGGKGAAIGALAGGGAGTAGAAYTGNKDVAIASETLVRFRLTEPMTLR